MDNPLRNVGPGNAALTAQEAARRAAQQAVAEAARRAAQATPSPRGGDTFTASPTRRGPDLAGGSPPANAGSSLLTEDISDGSVNCLDLVGDFLSLSSPAIRARSEVLFLADTRPGAEGATGHVVIRQGDNIYDPATQQWTDATSYFQSHPEYRLAGTVPGRTVYEILSAEPGPARRAALERANLPPGIARMVVADGPPMPDWLIRGDRPPWIEEGTWNALASDSWAQRAVLDSIRNGWPEFSSHIESLQPPWLENGTAPPPMSAAWARFSPADQQDLAQSRWNGFVQEEMALYFGGVPAGGVTVDAPLLGSRNGWPWGEGMQGEWATYHRDGVRIGIAQFLNTGVILNGPGQDYTHGNLCGELSAISAMGVGLVEGLKLFNDTNPGILLDTYALTTPDQLEAFFRAGGWRIAGEAPGTSDLEGVNHGADGAYWNNHLGTGVEPTPAQLQSCLENGGALLVLANIDGSQDGMMASAGSSDDITHWVNVLSVTENARGETYVRVYNPYQNREEVYTWDDFKASWHNPNTRELGYTYVAALPPP